MPSLQKRESELEELQTIAHTLMGEIDNVRIQNPDDLDAALQLEIRLTEVQDAIANVQKDIIKYRPPQMGEAMAASSSRSRSPTRIGVTPAISQPEPENTKAKSRESETRNEGKASRKSGSPTDNTGSRKSESRSCRLEATTPGADSQEPPPPGPPTPGPTGPESTPAKVPTPEPQAAPTPSPAKAEERKPKSKKQGTKPMQQLHAVGQSAPAPAGPTGPEAPEIDPSEEERRKQHLLFAICHKRAIDDILKTQKGHLLTGRKEKWRPDD